MVRTKVMGVKVKNGYSLRITIPQVYAEMKGINKGDFVDIVGVPNKEHLTVVKVRK